MCITCSLRTPTFPMYPVCWRKHHSEAPTSSFGWRASPGLGKWKRFSAKSTSWRFWARSSGDAMDSWRPHNAIENPRMDHARWCGDCMVHRRWAQCGSRWLSSPAHLDPAVVGRCGVYSSTSRSAPSREDEANQPGKTQDPFSKIIQEMRDHTVLTRSLRRHEYDEIIMIALQIESFLFHEIVLILKEAWKLTFFHNDTS